MKKVMIMVACLVFFAGVASADQLLINPGFETGNLDSWSTYDSFFATYENQSEGTYAARSSNVGTLFQVVPVLEGEFYTLSADAYIPTGGYGEWWGTYIAFNWLTEDETLIGEAWSINPHESARDTWNSFTSGSKLAPPGTAYAEVAAGTWKYDVGVPASPTDFDNFSLEGEPVPEPTTMILLGAGLIGLFGFSRKRRS